MAWSYRRSVSVGPVRLNFSKSGVGYSVGGPFYRVGRTATGKRYSTMRIPGTGLYNRTYQSTGQKSAAGSAQVQAPGKTSTVGRAIGSSLASGILFVFGIASFGAGYWLLGVILVLGAVGIAVQTALIGRKESVTRAYQEAKQTAGQELQSDKADDAITRLDPYIGKYPEDAEFLFLLGLCYAKTDEPDLAETTFKRLHEKANTVESVCLYADQLRHNGKVNDAVTILQKEPPEDPKQSGLYFAVLGQCFLDLGDPRAAIEACNRGPLSRRELDHDLLALHFSLAEAYEAAGDRKNALGEYEKVRVVDAAFEGVEDRMEKLRQGDGTKPA